MRIGACGCVYEWHEFGTFPTREAQIQHEFSTNAYLRSTFLSAIMRKNPGRDSLKDEAGEFKTDRNG